MSFARVSAVLIVLTIATCSGFAQKTTNDSKNPIWWDKYQYLVKNGADSGGGSTSSQSFGKNVDVSNECGPQSETYITINPNNPKMLAGGSNEIFRLPMRGYFSSNSGGNWGGVDLPLPSTQGTNSINFGSDPTLAFDRFNNLYYGYIVVYFGGGNGVNGSAMAVARSVDGGQSYSATFFGYEGGSNHFNDKPMITTGPNPTNTSRDNVYVAWDAASGGSTSAGLRVGTSSDQGATWTITRADDPQGQGRLIGAVPFVGPDNTLYVAWNDWYANTIAINSSSDGGAHWGTQSVVASKHIPFDVAVPAESFRGALVYPACDADRSNGPFRGRLYCSWMDVAANGVTTDIYLSYFNPSNPSAGWSTPVAVGDQIGLVDRFNHWLSVDQVTGDVNVSFYDTRNDTTGFRYMTDVYFTQSKDGGVTWRGPNTRVSTVSSNEHDCNGTFPCTGINYGNQQGDYEGLASYNGVSHPIWSDSRQQLAHLAGCSRSIAMEEVFSATVK
jgi:hypothetical protein